MSTHWTNSLHKTIQANAPIEGLLNATQCPICYDSYTHPVSLPCFHSFCSLCIRRSLYFHSVCPLCHQQTNTSEIKANFQLGQIAQLVKQLPVRLSQELAQDVQQLWSQRISKQRERRKAKGISIDEDEDEEKMEIDKECCEDETKSSTVAHSTATSIASVSSMDKVDCPICGLKVVSSLINRHLDACLGKEENREKLSTTPPTAAAATFNSSNSASRLPFPVYNMLSDKQLKKLLADQGFPSSGVSLDRDSLIRRHREFILRHNAELDSDSKPTPDATIIKDILRKEKVLTSSSMSKQSKQSLLLGKFAESTAPTNLTTSASTLPLFPSSTSLTAAGDASTAASSRKRSKSKADAPSSNTASVPTPALPPSDLSTTPRRSKRHSTSSRQSTPQKSPIKKIEIEAEDLTRDEDDVPMEVVDKTIEAASTIPMEIDPVEPTIAPNSVATAAPTTSHRSSTKKSIKFDPPPAAPSTHSSSPSTDPFVHLIQAYEAKHGPRKRWRRAWGIDESLYLLTKYKPPPVATPTPAPINESTSTDPALTESTTSSTKTSEKDDDVTIDTTRTTRSKKSAKSVFSLFQTNKAEPSQSAASSTATAAPSTSSSDEPKPASKKSTSGAIRVPTAICTSCRSICHGSFPLGASITCPRCRPNWTELHQLHASDSTSLHQRANRTNGSSTPPLIAPSGKLNWQQLAAQQLAVNPPPPESHDSSSTSTAAPATDAPSSSLSPHDRSADQKRAIEARRLAALEKLRAKQSTTPVQPSSTNKDEPMELTNMNEALSTQSISEALIPTDERKESMEESKPDCVRSSLHR